MDRMCAKCSTELVPGSFYDGRKNLCKECHKDEMRLRRRVDDDSPEDDDTPMCKNRACTKCSAELLPDNFYPSWKTVCKQCFSSNVKDRKRAHEELPEDGPDFEVVETFIPQKKDHLYAMQNSRLFGEIKVGRSHDPEHRAKDLGKSQNFKMQILKVFHFVGHLESTVHKRLKQRHSTEGDGIEWFRIDMQTLDMIITGVIAESQL